MPVKAALDGGGREWTPGIDGNERPSMDALVGPPAKPPPLEVVDQVSVDVALRARLHPNHRVGETAGEDERSLRQNGGHKRGHEPTLDVVSEAVALGLAVGAVDEKAPLPAPLVLLGGEPRLK
eukprot:4201938-Prymnesium_polylepis.1